MTGKRQNYLKTCSSDEPDVDSFKDGPCPPSTYSFPRVEWASILLHFLIIFMNVIT